MRHTKYCLLYVLALTQFFVSCSKQNATIENDIPLAVPSSVNAAATQSTVLLTWEKVPNADGYAVEIAKGATFSIPFFRSDTIQSSEIRIDDLDFSTTYTIRLRAISLKSPSLTSEGAYHTFKTLEPEVEEENLAFPGADGYGKLTTGGRGGRVIKVTNLNNAGAGSLRAAVEASGPRIVVFEVSGNIKLQSRLNIRNGDLTIAGQTAPGDGICVQDHDISISASNVIIRFIRARLGDTNVQTIESDVIGGRNIQNVIIDHCSFSWSIDEVASFYHNRNFTMQWCMITESMNNSGHAKGNHGYGGIWGGTLATFHHNLIAHHTNRNPRFDGGLRYSNGSGTQVGVFGPDKIDYVNNVIYNWSGNSAYGGENGEYNIVNNYYKAGPATPNNRASRILQVSKDNATNAPNPGLFGDGYGKFHIDGNFVFGFPAITTNNWNGVIYDSGITQAMARNTARFPFFQIDNLQTAEQAFESVLQHVGASLSRDAVDQRITSEVRNGTATYSGSRTKIQGIIDTQADVGGWPVLQQGTVLVDTDGDGMPDAWEIANGLNPNVANANGRDLSKVYDNIEVYLNSLVNHLY